MTEPKPRSPRKPPARCGTPAGYHRHKRLDEDVCEQCMAANSLATAARRRRNRQAEGYVSLADRVARPDTVVHSRDADTWPGRA